MNCESAEEFLFFFPHFLHNIVSHDGSLFFDSGSAREQVAFANKVRSRTRVVV